MGMCECAKHQVREEVCVAELVIHRKREPAMCVFWTSCSALFAVNTGSQFEMVPNTSSSFVFLLLLFALYLRHQDRLLLLFFCAEK